jgi:hypothetical protein
MDIFGITADYLIYLSYEGAKEVIPDLKEDVFNKVKKEYTAENVIKEIIDYLPFAFEKAYGQRGISANRSMEHFKAWTWLLGAGDSFNYIEDWDDDYHSYGVPKLIKLKKKFDPDGKYDEED